MSTAEQQYSRPSTKSQLVETLNEIGEECADADWDGYGAKAVSGDVILRAKEFVHALPSSIPAPEISAEADGQISFDWLPSRTRTFTVSVGAGDRLAYAWIDGASRGKGTETIKKEALPPRLLNPLLHLTKDVSSRLTRPSHSAIQARA